MVYEKDDFIQKQILYLQISMHDFELMESSNAEAHLSDNLHNNGFFQKVVIASHRFHFVTQISAICIFHHQTSHIWIHIEKRVRFFNFQKIFQIKRLKKATYQRVDEGSSMKAALYEIIFGW